MSDTPKTDAFFEDYDGNLKDLSRFARELERENAALREDRARLDYLTQSLGWIVVGWPEMDPSDYATEEGTLTDFWIAAIAAARAKEGQP